MAFEERVAAAADAGFDAIGLSVWEYDRLRAEGYDDNKLRTALDRHDMRVAELEVVLGFAATGPDRLRHPLPGLDYTDRDTEARFFEMATLFGARHLQAVGTFNSEQLEDQAVDAFAALYHPRRGNGNRNRHRSRAQQRWFVRRQLAPLPRPQRRPATWSPPLDSPATAQPPSAVPRLLEPEPAVREH